MRGLRGVGALLAILVLAATALMQRGGGDAGPAQREPATGQAPVPVATTVGFRSSAGLNEHYQKHRHEFGAISKAEYLEGAQALRDRPVGGEILEIRRSDGVVTRFDRAAGAFIAFDPDGTIRTYFRPNDGERYFRRQAARTGSRE
jgi:pyocin large subunit-like protein